jgi:phosphonate utilization transcriptional regulator
LQIVDNLQVYGLINAMTTSLLETISPVTGSESALHAKIALLQSNSLSMVVQQEIERAILVGEYAPGSKLTEASLAAQLGVSRGPIREAFRMLEEAGLLQNEKNRGVFVRSIPLEEAVEIYDLRAAMEEHVGRQLAANISAAQLKEIRTLVEAMERAAKAKDARTYHLLNLGFHNRLVEMTSNKKLNTVYRKLTNELSLFRRINLAQSWLLPTSAGEHRHIVKAIASGDSQAAGQALYEHVMASKQRAIDNESKRRSRAGQTLHATS